jgi:hypothetical protein
VKLKSGVESKSVSPAIWYALGLADRLAHNYVCGEVVVTSLTDGIHKATSLHYPKNSPDGLGCAGDLRSRSFLGDERPVFFRELGELLRPLGFDVVNEGDHFHIEFDPKDGRAFPWGIDGHTSSNTTS